jgi:hypothetical protein
MSWAIDCIAWCKDVDDAALMKLAEEYGGCISAVIMRVSASRCYTTLL